VIIEKSDLQTAPQFPNIAIGQQYELLDWLKYVTFPAEERLGDTDFATVLYKEVVRRVLAFGVSASTFPLGVTKYPHAFSDDDMLLLWITTSRGNKDPC
jgi:cytosine/adenosine deaminase-related metal-dependent hydrolase